jgi:mRNA-degrading endonuclease RelE of RelBE toxin-antitoxin system
MHKIAYTETFARDIKRLDKPVAKRIVNKILEAAKNPYNIKPLRYSPKDLPNLYKLRAGDWRILFWIDHKEKIITLYAIERRSRIYRDLK